MKADVEGAKKLLAEAGYPNGGFKIEIKCSPQYPEFVATTLVIQESLKKLNVDVTVTQMEWGAFVADNKKSNDSCGKEGTDIYSSANTFRPDPDGYLYPYFHSKGEINKGGCDTPDPKLDGCWSRRASRATTAERQAPLPGDPAHVMQDSLDWWWYAKYNIEAMSSKLQGYSQSFTGRRLFLKKAWLA